MAQARENLISGALASYLDRDRICALAREVGAVRRQRKVDMGALVHALVFGFGAGRNRSFNGARLAYELISGQRLARSSFHDRFTPEFAELLQRLVEDGLSEERQYCSSPVGTFRPFEEVLAIDSCIITLHDKLKDNFGGVRHAAEAKLTMVTNISERSPRSFQLEQGRTSDIHLFELNESVRGRLFIFDLGFYSERLFCRIERQHGFFLSRMRKHCNPRIVKVFDSNLRQLEGYKWKQLKNQLELPEFEFETEVVERCYMTGQKRVTRLRVIAIHNSKEGRFHLYITNAPQHMLVASHTTAVYAARWEIELLFRELQSDYRLAEFATRNEHAVRALLYASILTLLVSRRLRRTLCPPKTRTGVHASTDRWARLFANLAQYVFAILAAPTPRLYRRQLERIFRSEALDPNRKRLKLPQRAQYACSFAH